MVETRPERKVIVIPAREKTPEEQERKKNLRVAAYCRVSTNSEEQLSSYENQLAYYTEKIMKNPEWTMMEVFADEGITGTSTSKRKNFLRMIRQCRQGKIDLILTKSISRFARNTVDTLNYTRELRSLGIPVIFEEHGLNSIYPESEFLITIFGAQAQAESESTSSRVRWGVQQSMRDGRASIQYKYLLGYRKGADGQMEIVPEEAETVRQIYRMYLAGQPLRNIRTSLVSEGRRNALGTTEWTTSNLQTILTDEKYCGDVLRQKTFIQDCISKKAIRNTGQLPKYLIQNHHDAIIDRAQFDAVQMELARRRAQRGSTRPTSPIRSAPIAFESLLMPFPPISSLFPAASGPAGYTGRSAPHSAGRSPRRRPFQAFSQRPRSPFPSIRTPAAPAPHPARSAPCASCRTRRPSAGSLPGAASQTARHSVPAHTKCPSSSPDQM